MQDVADEIDRIISLMSSHDMVVVRDWRGGCRLAVWEIGWRSASGSGPQTVRSLRFLDLPRAPSSSALHTMLEAGFIEMTGDYASTGASVHVLTREGYRLAQWRVEMRRRASHPQAALPAPKAIRSRVDSARDARVAAARRRVALQMRLIRRLARIGADTALAESLLASMLGTCRLFEAHQKVGRERQRAARR